jgi:uncharacterized integral membrane protein
MMWLRRLLALALFGAALVGGWLFAAHNREPTEVDYLFGALPAEPLWAVLGGAFGLGVLVSAGVALVVTARAKLLARRYRKLAARLEAEVHQLRNLPLAVEDEGAPRSSAGGVPGLRAVAGSPDRNG